MGDNKEMSLELIVSSDEKFKEFKKYLKNQNIENITNEIRGIVDSKKGLEIVFLNVYLEELNKQIENRDKMLLGIIKFVGFSMLASWAVNAYAFLSISENQESIKEVVNAMQETSEIYKVPLVGSVFSLINFPLLVISYMFYFVNFNKNKEELLKQENLEILQKGFPGFLSLFVVTILIICLVVSYNNRKTMKRKLRSIKYFMKTEKED